MLGVSLLSARLPELGAGLEGAADPGTGAWEMLQCHLQSGGQRPSGMCWGTNGTGRKKPAPKPTQTQLFAEGTQSPRPGKHSQLEWLELQSPALIHPHAAREGSERADSGMQLH